MGFDYDLSRGKKVEELVAKYLRDFQGWDAQVVPGYEKRWDIVSSQGTVEVKYDPMSDKTGNFVVEIEFGGKPSAITTTEADYWVFVDHTHMYWIAPESLRSLLSDHKHRLREFVGRGDKKPKKAYLIPKSTFEYSPYFMIMKI